MVTSLRSKWAVGKARGGRISKLIRNRRATQPPAHFQRNPPGRGQLAVFPRCSLLTYQFRYARRSRLEKQPTDRRRKPCYLWDRTLGQFIAKPARISKCRVSFLARRPAISRPSRLPGKAVCAELSAIALAMAEVPLIGTKANGKMGGNIWCLRWPKIQ